MVVRIRAVPAGAVAAAAVAAATAVQRVAGSCFDLFYRKGRVSQRGGRYCMCCCCRMGRRPLSFGRPLLPWRCTTLVLSFWRALSFLPFSPPPAATAIATATATATAAAAAARRTCTCPPRAFTSFAPCGQQRLLDLLPPGLCRRVGWRHLWQRSFPFIDDAPTFDCKAYI